LDDEEEVLEDVVVVLAVRVEGDRFERDLSLLTVGEVILKSDVRDA
jgi:hypothetical protein